MLMYKNIIVSTFIFSYLSNKKNLLYYFARSPFELWTYLLSSRIVFIKICALCRWHCYRILVRQGLVFVPDWAYLSVLLTQVAQVRFLFTVWACWHWSTLDWLVLSFFPTTLNPKREKYLGRAGIEPRSSCFTSDHSNHLAMAPRATDC